MVKPSYEKREYFHQEKRFDAPDPGDLPIPFELYSKDIIFCEKSGYKSFPKRKKNTKPPPGFEHIQDCNHLRKNPNKQIKTDIQQTPEKWMTCMIKTNQF